MIPVGVLNRVRASVKLSDHAELNVSASYLAKEGVELSVQGNFTDFLPAMTGAVQSPQPYVIIQARIHLVRSQALAAQYKKQWEANSAIGDARLYTDSSVFGDFDLHNTAITSVQDMSFAGGDPGVVITITGTYYVNDEMWDI
ncbi:hypothetical protein EHB58_09470 [Salmonella enterica subsp. enterica serovar Hull]|uniref:Uncharacterized protein n=1 Tax=Salmonella enterica subsp. enterica serovar Hull TaxID=1403564 RepID=A0A5X4PE81_SALET|nr:hypothetical protein [Salmonella enterica]EBZ7585854.1 hypothetical protein [Salmonella enterica subsp. enterica serovar Hull]ECF2938608.1 hypothetical protein [Salmonella enterica subsp. enterica serovar Reading]ECN6005588.1 hypothetical protein [Salmonella enterica subsp. enterica serovar Brandenburg]EDU6784095.1 hypothetical protein [Salmonella enterica subsp. enterica serovar Gaminara]EHB3478027.1 hypothetical protein [Salmonella enterica subsp. enterica serovar Newport]